jgi:hypothetical protein
LAIASVGGVKITFIKKGKVPIDTTEKTIDNNMNRKYSPILVLYALR